MCVSPSSSVFFVFAYVKAAMPYVCWFCYGVTAWEELWFYCMVAITTARWRSTSGSGQGAEARRSVSFRFGHSLVFLSCAVEYNLLIVWLTTGIQQSNTYFGWNSVLQVDLRFLTKFQKGFDPAYDRFL